MVGRKGEAEARGKEQQIKQRWIMGVSVKEKKYHGIMGVRHCMMGAHPVVHIKDEGKAESTFIKEIEISKRENKY